MRTPSHANQYSTTPIFLTIFTCSPVSSLTSRTAACSRDSPSSSVPLGRPQTPSESRPQITTSGPADPCRITTPPAATARPTLGPAPPPRPPAPLPHHHAPRGAGTLHLRPPRLRRLHRHRLTSTARTRPIAGPGRSRPPPPRPPPPPARWEKRRAGAAAT